MAVFKNGIFAYDNGKPVTPQQVGIDYPGIQTCQQFFSSGSITDVTQKSALYILVGDLQNYGIWDKMKAIYPMVGQVGVSSSFQLNLKDPNTFRGTFYGTWSFNENGVTPDGSTGYMDTNLTPSTSLSLNNTHVSVYVRTNINTGCAIGNTSTIDGIDEISLYPRLGGLVYARVNAASGNITTSTDSRAMHIGSRISPTEVKYYRNLSSFSLNNNSNSLVTSTLVIGAIKISNSIFNYFNGQITFSSIGDGLTDTEAANLYTAVQRFQTTLGRQV